MIKSYLDSNLCDHTNDILAMWGKSQTVKKYFPNSSASNGLQKDVLQKQSVVSNTTDGKDDGKISFKEKVKNFGKGLIQPITTIFKSPKNILLTAAGIAAGAGLIAITGGAAAPVMVAAGLVGGGVQIGKGIYKQVNAKTDNEAKQAWQQMGTGTFTVGASAVGAKSALKASGTNTANMSMWASVKNCIKSAPKNIGKSVSNASSKISSAINAGKASVSNNLPSTIIKNNATSSSAPKSGSVKVNSNPQNVEPDVITLGPDDYEIIDASTKVNKFSPKYKGDIIDSEFKDIPSWADIGNSSVVEYGVTQKYTPNPLNSEIPQNLSRDYFVQQEGRLKISSDTLANNANITNIRQEIPKDIPRDYFVPKESRLKITADGLKKNTTNQGIAENSSNITKNQSLFGKITSGVKQLFKVFGLFRSEKP